MSGSWLIVDVDDTLVDTYDTGRRKCVEVARLMGLTPPPPHEFRAVYGTRSFAECVRSLHPGVAVAEYSAAYDSLAEWAPPKPIGRVRFALECASAAGFRTGVLTNGDGRKTRLKLAALGLSGSDFEFVCHSGNSPVPKPSVEAFRRLEREFGVQPGSSWYVSDQGSDWRASAEAGFGAIGVITGGAPTRAAGQVPTLLVPSLDSIAACMPQLVSAGDVRASDVRARAPVRHVGVDAGFTLIDHVRSPGRLLGAELAARDVRVDGEEIDGAFGAQLPAEWSVQDSWESDLRIDAALTRLYRAVLDAVLDPDSRVGGAERERVVAAAVRAYTRPENWRARTGAAAALKRLRTAGLAIGVLSNWQSDLPEVLAATGLAPFVDVICASAGSGAVKPDPAAFRVLADAMGVHHPSSMVFCGDDAVGDVGGALLSGCRAALINQTWEHDAVREAMEVIVS